MALLEGHAPADHHDGEGRYDVDGLPEIAPLGEALEHVCDGEHQRPQDEKVDRRNGGRRYQNPQWGQEFHSLPVCHQSARADNLARPSPRCNRPSRARMMVVSPGTFRSSGMCFSAMIGTGAS
jgi:hypothetical protein